MRPTQLEKAIRFRELHQGPATLLMPNPWDVGSARMLASLGFEALATSSSASAAADGRFDGQLGRAAALAHAHIVVEATDLPVSGDLENGFGDDPEAVRETIRLAAEAGLVGASIEDSSGQKDRPPLYDLGHAVERITAAAETARALPFPFTLTARAENFFRGVPDLDDAIRRLVAYEKAGADVLFAPALPDLAAVRAVCQAVSRPVNFMVGVKGKSFSAAALAEAGVRRISFASSLYRAAMTGLWKAARDIKERGDFSYIDDSLSMPDLLRMLTGM